MTEEELIQQANTKSEQFDSQPTGTGTNYCSCTLEITHIDTLGMPFPKGIVVVVYDDHGNKVIGKTNHQGISKHNVHCGEVFWQLECGEKDSKGAYLTDGRVLIKATNTITSDKVKHDNPKMQLATPLKLGVTANQAKITASYLPPPIICNIRKEEPEENDLLTPEQIEQLTLAGKNATIFIHGYNVPMGKMGVFADADDFGNKLPSSQRFIKSQQQRPFLRYTREEAKKISENRLSDLNKVFQKRVQEQNDILHPFRRSEGAIKQYSLEELKSFARLPSEHIILEENAPDTINNELNGTGSYATMSLIEYYLNKAAANLDDGSTITEWDKYTRIVGIAWSGNNDMIEFNQSILQANLAARRLAKVLRQLIDTGISVNIITHSLGARVALGALNILGDFDGCYNGKVDNVFLWQPAVADNALSNNLDNDKGPIKETVFTFAHKSASHISVLHSKNDGILGGDDTPDSGVIEKITSAVGGAYPKRYWWIASGTSAMGQYYKEFLPHYSTIGKKYPHEDKLTLDQLADRDIAVAIKAEANKVNENQGIALVNYLSPWAHYRRFSDRQVDDIIGVLQGSNNVRFDVQEYNVRPALGHAGDKFTIIGEGKKEEIDNFLVSIAFPNGTQLSFLDQHAYYKSHSALSLDNDRKYFPTIYKKSYKDEIMFKIKNQSAFGKY